MSVLTPYMVNTHKWNWRYKTGFFYAGVGAIWVIGSWLIIPETAGLVVTPVLCERYHLHKS